MHSFQMQNQTFSEVDHILGHKSNLSKFKSKEIISSIFSDHNGRETRNQPQERNKKTWKLNNMPLKK